MTPQGSPWLTAKQAGAYLGRSPRFILREIHSGRLRAARVGGRREVITCAAWCDQWVTDQVTPIAMSARRRA
jgi:excisionase family DNA binding protein